MINLKQCDWMYELVVSLIITIDVCLLLSFHFMSSHFISFELQRVVLEPELIYKEPSSESNKICKA